MNTSWFPSLPGDQPNEEIIPIGQSEDETPESDPRVTTWADGFGRWYARVPKHAVSPLIAARRAIRDELVQRLKPTVLHGHYWMHLERVEDYDEGDTIVYAEPTLDTDECPRCKEGSVTWTRRTSS